MKDNDSEPKTPNEWARKLMEMALADGAKDVTQENLGKTEVIIMSGDRSPVRPEEAELQGESDEFAIHVLEPLELVPRYVTTAQKPKRGVYLGFVEWGWGPGNSRADAYYLTLEGDWWLLWERSIPDDLSDPTHVEWTPLAYGPSRAAGMKTAAVKLLQAAWAYQRDSYGLDQFHLISEAAEFSVEDFKAIGKVVWGEGK